MLNEALKSKKTLIMGGAKVEDKIGVIDNLTPDADLLILGGAMCFTFLKAKGLDVGSSLVSEEHIEYAKGVLEKYGDKIVLPVDVMTQNGVKSVEELTGEDVGYDIGPKTIEIYKNKLRNSNMVLWNGPLGKYEEDAYENGTKYILKFLEKQEFKTILAGGDVVAACSYFDTNIYYVSTGGGSTLEYLEGKRFKTLERLKGSK